MSDADSRSVARRTLIVIGLVLATVVALAFVRATRLVLRINGRNAARTIQRSVVDR